MTEFGGTDVAGGASDRPVRPERVDVLVATYESARTLDACLASARRHLPVERLIVVDRASQDGTRAIAERAGAVVLTETVGLGRARNVALREADTEAVVFLDSDVVVERPDFFDAAWEEFTRPRTAAVVGMSVGHRFCYGLPLGLTLVGRRWALAAGMPDDAQGRESYYLQRAARRQGLRVRYVPESMRHFGTYRRAAHWPEFQGASIRRASGLDPREPLYAAEVVLLMHLNSRSVRNVAYSPVFYLKLLRGFLAPSTWGRIDRSAALEGRTLGPK